MNKELQGLQTITKQVAANVHDYLYSAIKLPDQDKATLIAGILIALENKNFKDNYSGLVDSEEFIDSFMSAIKNSIKRFDGLKNHKEAIIANFDFIKNNPNFRTKLEREGKTYIALQMLVSILEKSIYRIAKEYPSYDILGEFYNEFTKYSGADQQQLGIVLTPHHIASFMSDLLEINDTDVILDTCCGSGSLPLTADAKSAAPNKIVGVEFNARMLSLAVANMMIRGIDCHLLNGDSWQENIMEDIKAQKPTKFIINPPYSQPGYPELGFIKRALDCLQPGGLGVAIVPMSCAIKNDNNTKAIKKAILHDHTLLGTFSMPDQLFYPVGVVTVVMLFKAHEKHSGETFFGYLKDDGFEITRTEGRKDVDGKWLEIKTNMEELYKEKKSEAGESAIAEVDGASEWCCEAYLESDYSCVSEEDFERELKLMAIHLLNMEEK